MGERSTDIELESPRRSLKRTAAKVGVWTMLASLPASMIASETVSAKKEPPYSGGSTPEQSKTAKTDRAVHAAARRIGRRILTGKANHYRSDVAVYWSAHITNDFEYKTTDAYDAKINGEEHYFALADCDVENGKITRVKVVAIPENNTVVDLGDSAPDVTTHSAVTRCDEYADPYVNARTSDGIKRLPAAVTTRVDPGIAVIG